MKDKKQMKFFINSIFQSIQGEGLFIGTPMNFIRFTKCDKSCNWCDTDFKEGKEMTMNEILEKLNSKFQWVSLTGGEPMLEDNLFTLIKKLKEKKYNVFLETNGTLFDEKVFSESDFVSIGLKVPSSGNSFFDKEVFSYAIKNPEKTQLKVVIQNDADISFFRGIYKKNKSYGNWILQPEWSAIGKLAYIEIMEKFPKVRIIPQVHKILKLM